MDASEYKKMAEAIQIEIESLEIQQEDIERRIARLKQALIGLAPLADESQPSGLGAWFGEAVTTELQSMSISDVTRQIFQAASKPLAPTEVKQQLLNMGKDLSGQKNLMASIHSLLKRLVASGDIETRDNGLTYQWKTRRRRNPFGTGGVGTGGVGTVVGDEVGPLTMPPAGALTMPPAPLKGKK
jgi:hypothetical protein